MKSRKATVPATKNILIPENVSLMVREKEGDETRTIDFSFAAFMVNNPLSHASFGKNIDDLEACQSMIDRLAGAKPGETVQLTPALWEHLNKLVNFPEQPYDPKVGLQLLPFFRAVRDAQ